MSIADRTRQEARAGMTGNTRHLPSAGTARRWAIWSLQSQQGQGPCFATDARFTCGQKRCPWWRECQGLKVEWRR